jgi:PAS domain S-box-containing protein
VAGSGVELGSPSWQFARLGEDLFSGLGFEPRLVNEAGEAVVLARAPVSSGGEVPVIDSMGWIVSVEQERSEAFAAIRQLRTVAIATGFVAALAAAGLAYLLSRALTRQVDEIDKVFRAAAVGDFDVRAEILSGDELGTTAEGVNAMLGQLAGFIAAGEAQLQAVFHHAGSIIIATDVDGTITTWNRTAEELLGYTADEVVGKASPAIIHDEDEVVQRAQVLSQELGQRVDPGFDVFVIKPRLGVVERETLEWTYVRKDGTRFPVLLSVTTLRNAQDEIIGFIGIGADITERKLVEQDVAGVVQLLVGQSGTSADVAARAAASAQEGADTVGQTMAAMERIRDNTQETARRMKRLGEASQEISEVVRLIEEVADRTTVLALNASIQAASAGEAGRGFAVVAEEVQRLAERATSETRRIEDLVKTIQSETGEAVVGVEEATREVVEGSQLAQSAGDRMSDLRGLVDELADLMQHVAETSAQQASESLTLLAGGTRQPVEASDGGNGALPQTVVAGDGTYSK